MMKTLADILALVQSQLDEAKRSGANIDVPVSSYVTIAVTSNGVMITGK
jgi:hypothetical protein